MKTTNCKTCNTSIAYATKKPLLCKKCKPKKVYKKSKTPPQRSKKEAQMQYALNDILPEAVSIDNGYYSFLKSPKNAPMQVDRLYPELKLGFEFNGKQHYEYNAFMHATKEAFEYLQTCDKLKAKRLKELGYTLISIKYDKTITHEYLLRRLEEAGILEQLKKQTRVRD